MYIQQGLTIELHGHIHHIDLSTKTNYCLSWVDYDGSVFKVYCMRASFLENTVTISSNDRAIQITGSGAISTSNSPTSAIYKIIGYK